MREGLAASAARQARAILGPHTARSEETTSARVPTELAMLTITSQLNPSPPIADHKDSING